MDTESQAGYRFSMPEGPHSLFKSPNRIDVLADLLQTNRLHNLVFGRVELGAPWAISFPALGHFSFYVVSRGGAVLEVEGEKKPIVVSSGDVVMLPNGAAHLFHDVGGKTVRAIELNPL